MPVVPDVNRVARQLLGDAQHSGDPRAFRLRTLELLDTVTPFDSAIFLSGPRLAAPPVSVNKERAAHFHALYLAGRDRYVAELEPTRRASLVQGGAYLDTEVFSAVERGKLGFFREIIHPQHIQSQVVLHLRFRDQLVAAVHLCRHGRVGSFRPRDRGNAALLSSALTLAHVASSGLAPAEAHGRAQVDLSQRERQIAAHVCQGLRTWEIAQALGTSPHTVRNQIQRLYEKTGTRRRTELVLLLSRGAAHPLGNE